MALLEIAGLGKRYGSFNALAGADLTVEAGEFHGLIGPNGSGKSTFLKCLAGAQLPTAGSIRLGGRDITSATPRSRTLAGLSIKFQMTSILPDLTVYDHMLLACQSRESLLSLALSRSRCLSHGEQQWLDIAMAMALEPKLLLLDEPTAGMSVEERRMTGDILRPLRGRCSIVIVEHDLDFIRGLVDRMTVLDHGKILACGTVDDIQANTQVQNVYLKRI
ncbi:ATP-binding cassette domain-containing protein [Agrobacterium vitis]|uniref:ABC transporter ATP-binding protein n=1 Tax=Agrobacterium vitis TaxID=373 RepID=UPI0012E77239|nr:ATP-binding cassette domain-containing protein [Agrobacterium vitis]MVA22056.1 ATP-binding cassette domain-containing protein [Agrobacterium vitis]